MRLEILNERRAPGVARVRITKRVKLQRNAIMNVQLLEQLIAKRQQLHIRRGFGGTDHFSVKLVELAEAAFLRPFVTKCRPCVASFSGANCCQPSLR